MADPKHACRCHILTFGRPIGDLAESVAVGAAVRSATPQVEPDKAPMPAPSTLQSHHTAESVPATDSSARLDSESLHPPGTLLAELEARQEAAMRELAELDERLITVLKGLGVTPVEEEPLETPLRRAA